MEITQTWQKQSFNPLTTRWSKSATLLWEFLAVLVLNIYLCNLYTVEIFVSAVCSKKQNQFIFYTTHFRPVYVPKSRFFAKKAVHCSGALLKKRKRFSLYLLNGYRYNKNFNRFWFQVQRTIISAIFRKIWWKISSHCKKIEKTKILYILVTTGEKKSNQKLFIF